MKPLGDAVKSVTDTLGIPQCGGCKERQEKLNEIDQRVRERWLRIAETYKKSGLMDLYNKIMLNLS